MLLKKGIVRKTFLFSSSLILFVVLVSFAVMYFIMPGHYLTQKEKNLQNNLDNLTMKLQTAKEDECAALISDFSTANNVTVLSFDENDVLIPAISTPFLGMSGNADMFFVSEMQAADSDGRQAFLVQVHSEKGIAGSTGNIFSMNLRVGMQGENIISLKNHVGTQVVDYVVANGTLQPIDEAKDVILSLIPYVLAIAIIVGLILSGVYARQISKPVLQISDAALKMQQMIPGVQSGIETRDELGTLSANLDALYLKFLENIGYLKDEMDKVNRLESSKTELMQNASHELKTPIAALSGMIEGMIDNVGAYKDKEKYLVECKNQIDKLSHLVAEILSASKSDIDCHEPELADTNIDELVERAISENMYQIHEKNLNLESNLSGISINTNSGILYHSISSLISNAVNYTPHGGKIRVSIIEDGSARKLVIENECEPITKEELPKLFEPFYTRSYSRDKRKSGTGLGLYIVKRGLGRLGIPYEAEITGFGFSISLTV